MALVHPDLARNATVVFLLTALFHWARFKYGERSYRFALLEAGHLAQNIHLVSAALGVGSVPIGGFIDDELNRLVGVNGVDEAVVYAIAVGAPGQDRTGVT